ncbi:MAG TPA: diguanylate cyclase [Solirubrobacteraceae bacterium]|jgi:two-component system cell cycle response regulator|nr:diguanylate cyclase [Solirubrobacteraceae bacterium]
MPTITRIRPLPITLTLALLVGGLGVLALHTLAGMGAAARAGLFDHTIYGVLMAGATATVLARAASVRAQRGAWLAMGAGLFAWCLGDLYYALLVEGPGAAGGSVSPADALHLAFYPCCYVALVLLLGAHLRELRIGMWLDGLIGGLAAAGVAAALILPPILHHAHGDTASLGVALAYPIGDLLLLVFAIGALGTTGWHPGRVWLLIAAALLASAAGDSGYLYLTATDSYHVGDWVQFLWPTSAVLLAIAAWTPWPRPTRRHVEDWRLVSVPSFSLLAALGVLIYGDLLHTQLTPVALILATATVLVVCVHLMLTVRENIAMLASSRRLALTDPLTGLGNRRQLMEDLNVACRRAGAGETWELLLYDLNGFKRYNDTFGHPAGDALLARLSDKLRTVVAPYGTAYRMGGDEFCALLRDCSERIDALAAASVAALSERGPGFAIGAAHGVVCILPELDDPAVVLQLADQRLYRRKEETREASAVHQLRDVLLQAFQERHPDLQEHQRGVGALVLEVGKRLGMNGEELDVLARAAELHDVGKIAIPDAILTKPGALDAEEWRFMIRHTILGERILSAAAALRPVAKLVRSSHERFDGNGYPDGLCGEAIPLGARIIFVCDAFDAMISERSYSSAISTQEAIAELRACAGTQFDPAVVDTFVASLTDPPASPATDGPLSLDAEDAEHALAAGQRDGHLLAGTAADERAGDG